MALECGRDYDAIGRVSVHVRQETGVRRDGSIYWNLDYTPVEQVTPATRRER